MLCLKCSCVEFIKKRIKREKKVMFVGKIH
jgi:hypothetical protein